MEQWCHSYAAEGCKLIKTTQKAHPNHSMWTYTYPKTGNSNPKYAHKCVSWTPTDILKNVHSSNIHNSPKQETRQKSINSRINKWIVVYLYSRPTSENEQTSVICNNVHESNKCKVEQNKPDTKKYILCGPIYTMLKKKKIGRYQLVARDPAWTIFTKVKIVISSKGMRGSDWEGAQRGLLGHGSATNLTGDNHMGIHLKINH